ncbi:MAG: NADH-quinone oxidoreductase subunit C [Magnetococcales bacterium]|nr:NADH-quinone oxidoreductase subunit C [Magnetococcales bacterium]
MIETILDNLAGSLEKLMPEVDRSIGLDAVVLTVARDDLLTILKRLRDEPALDFKLMIDITAIHYPEAEKPLVAVYQFLSVKHNHRIRVKVPLSEGESVPSIIGLWRCANWYEREMYEMFGILVSDHPDLRRLLTEYDFEGHPLRKEFPVYGRFQVKYDEEQRRVVRKPTKLEVPFREIYGRDG